MMPRALALATIVLGAIGLSRAAAQPASVAPVAHIPSAPSFQRPVPKGLEEPGLLALWNQGLELERSDRFLAAAKHTRELVHRVPQLPHGYWLISRNLWRHAEALPPDAKEARLEIFERAEGWATQGLAVDAACAECMLWKFGAMGRIATTRGILSSLRSAPEMRDLLETAVALDPSYADTYDNSTLGNLYYASAVFYRVVPDWRWLEWLLDVRGDIGRSLEMARGAVRTAGQRIDFNVELGAVLLCYAQRRDAEWAAREGRQVLVAAPTFPKRLNTDAIDLEHAAVLLAEPEKACGYSRDGWIDTDEIERRRASLH